MIEFSVKATGIEAMRAQVEAIAPKQLPFIMALALTETAKDVQEVVKNEMRRDIDRPSPFTLNSLYSTRATKQKLEASVEWRSFAGKGTPGGKYLRPIAESGGRALKRSEVALKRTGVLPSGYYLTPGGDATLDQYGNVRANLYVQVLSYLKSFGESGFLANRTEKSQAKGKRRLSQFFAVQPGHGRLAPGIYQRMASRLKLIFAFVKAPHYRVTFPFQKITERAATERMPIRFEEAVVKALSTARPDRLR